MRKSEIDVAARNGTLTDTIAKRSAVGSFGRKFDMQPISIGPTP
jgi:hypothetical protein